MGNPKVKCPDCGKMLPKNGLTNHRKWKHQESTEEKKIPTIDSYRQGYRDGWRDRAA